MIPFPSTRRALVLATLAFGVTAAPAAARELVRVRISEFTGAEPAVVDSVRHPELFALDPSIASAASNPAAPDKSDDGPGRFLPVLSPATPGVDGGDVDLVIRPQDARRCRSTASGSRRPRSSRPIRVGLVLRASFDDFATAFAVIDMQAPSARVVQLPSIVLDDDFALRWSAGNDFGEFGGGPAGFVDDDIVVSTETCSLVARTGCFEAERTPMMTSFDTTTPTPRTHRWLLMSLALAALVSAAAWPLREAAAAKCLANTLDCCKSSRETCNCVRSSGCLEACRQINGCGSIEDSAFDGTATLNPTGRRVALGGRSAATPTGRSRCCG